MGAYVYLVNSDNTVSVRQIKVGPTYVKPNNASMATITSGLAAGDRVVTDGADRLRDGLHVNVTTVDGKEVAPRGAPATGGGRRAKRGQSHRAARASP
jgi:multidrug efflux system membrane fusion protein